MSWTEANRLGAGWTEIGEDEDGIFDARIFDPDPFDASVDPWTAINRPGSGWTEQ